MISLTGLVYLVVYVIVIGLIFFLLRWAVNTVPMDPPTRNIANIILTVFAVLLLIMVLLSFVGAMPGPLFRP